MKKLNLWRNKKGINTVEVVILLAIVVGIALIFREQILGFVNGLLGNITGTEETFNPNNMRGTGSLK